MAQIERTIRVYDAFRFHYDVLVKHYPSTGISIAYYRDDRIASIEYGRSLHPPIGDDDREWESYEQKLNELADELEIDIRLKCEDHFNRK